MIALTVIIGTPAYAQAPGAPFVAPIQWSQVEITAPPRDEYACNCYLYAKSKMPYLPLTKDLQANSACVAGAVALLRYGDMMHYAFIYEDNEEELFLDESNFKSCQYSKRSIARSDPHLEGCWFPN